MPFRRLAHNHDFTALWVGTTVSELGSRASMFVFPLVTFAITGSPLWAAAAEAVHLAGIAAALLPAGVLADRLDRRLLLRTSSGAGVLLYASLALTAYAGALTAPHILGVALLTGVAAGTLAPAETAAVRAVVPAEDLPTALSQNQAREHVAGLLGAPVGGALYAVARWLPFAVDAVTYAICWVLMGRIRADLSAPRRGQDRRPARQELREGFGFVWAHRLFRVLLVWGPLANLAVNALFFAATLRLITAGFPAWQIGLVETAVGAFGLLGAVAAPWLIDRVPTGVLTVTVAWSFVPLALPMSLWNHPAVVAAAASVGLFLNPAGNAGIGAYRLAVTPPDLVGRVQSASQFVSWSTLPLAPVVAGGALHLWPGGTAITVLAGLMAAVALLPTLSRSVREVPRPSVWAQAAPVPGRGPGRVPEDAR